jgi:hypothetical protein
MESYQNPGNLYVAFDASSAMTKTRRERSISRAAVRVIYEQDLTEFLRETLCSYHGKFSFLG